MKKPAKPVSGHSSKRPASSSAGRRTEKPVSRPGGGNAAGGKNVRTISPPPQPAPGEAVLREVVPPPVAPRKALSARSVKLQNVMLERRDKLMKAIQDQLGQALTEDQQRQFESAMDTGDQALMDLERELGISLQEKWNRERQMIDESLVNLQEGTYGICVECGTQINEKRLAVMPFTRLCLACQEKTELFEKIERGEQRS